MFLHSQGAHDKRLYECYIRLFSRYGADATPLHVLLDTQKQEIEPKKETPPQKRMRGTITYFSSDDEEDNTEYLKDERRRSTRSKPNYRKMASGIESSDDDDEDVTSNDAKVVPVKTKTSPNKKRKISVRHTEKLVPVQTGGAPIPTAVFLPSNDVSEICLKHRLVSRKCDCNETCAMKKYRGVFSAQVC
jgi:hypothetical protein